MPCQSPSPSNSPVYCISFHPWEAWLPSPPSIHPSRNRTGLIVLPPHYPHLLGPDSTYPENKSTCFIPSNPKAGHSLPLAHVNCYVRGWMLMLLSIDSCFVIMRCRRGNDEDIQARIYGMRARIHTRGYMTTPRLPWTKRGRWRWTERRHRG